MLRTGTCRSPQAPARSDSDSSARCRPFCDVLPAPDDPLHLTALLQPTVERRPKLAATHTSKRMCLTPATSRPHLTPRTCPAPPTATPPAGRSKLLDHRRLPRLPRRLHQGSQRRLHRLSSGLLCVHLRPGPQRKLHLSVHAVRVWVLVLGLLRRRIHYGSVREVHRVVPARHVVPQRLQGAAAGSIRRRRRRHSCCNLTCESLACCAAERNENSAR